MTDPRPSRNRLPMLTPLAAGVLLRPSLDEARPLG
jgi:hypothetical protein